MKSEKILSRRSMIKKAFSVGTAIGMTSISTSSALSFPNEISNVNISREIPFISHYEHTNRESMINGEAPQRKPVYDTVPRWKWEKVKSAHTAARKVKGLLEKNLESTKLVQTYVTTLENNEKGIRVVLTERMKTSEEPRKKSEGSSLGEKEVAAEAKASRSQVEQAIPSSISGRAHPEQNNIDIKSNIEASQPHNFPVFVEEETQMQADCQKWQYTHDYKDNIPGGCKIDAGHNPGGVGSTCTPAFHDLTNEYHIVTAGHVVEGTDDIWQPGGSFNTQGDSAGEVAAVINESVDDMASVRPPSEADTGDLPYYKYQIAAKGGGYRRPITGTVLWSTLQYMEGDTNFSVYQQGARSDVTSGYIYDLGVDNKIVRTTAGMHNGDSGGIIYERHSDDAKVIAISNWFSDSDSICPGDNSQGHHIGYIEDNLLLTV